MNNTLAYLRSLEMSGIKLGLEKIETFLTSISSPHKNFKSILVAGTNGKGSTSSMVAKLAQMGGLKVGLYTSPHILSVTERIKINDIDISEEDFVIYTQKIKTFMEEFDLSDPLTYFEFLTVLALLYFSDNKIDLAVLEVGMGGRLDATNVVNPIISIITEIGIDHSDFLGSTINEIALEKGGIIKNNGRVLITSQNKEVLLTISELCKEKEAILFKFGEDYSCKKIGDALCFKNNDLSIREIAFPISGNFQIQNGATAIQAALLLRDDGLTISEEQVKFAFQDFKMVGRFEVLKGKPSIVFDVAHNPNAAYVLSRAIQAELKYENLYILFGIMDDKDIDGFVQPLIPLAKAIVVTRPSLSRAASLDKIVKIIRKYSDMEIFAVEKVSEALVKSLSIAGPRDFVLITGSCYTVGEAKEGIKIHKNVT